MAVEVLELHHCGVCMAPDLAERMRSFYEHVLGLRADPGRPNIPGIPGYWMDLPGDTQIHLMGKDGPSPYAQSPDRDPVFTHVALGVADVAAAEEELRRLGTDYWRLDSVVGPQQSQLFFYDPAGNMIELHQVGVCRCKKSARQDPAGAPASMAG
jgi:catechol 2,3-dioxygenase-like lactoylglutathione lyase family enzyme